MKILKLCTLAAILLPMQFAAVMAADESMPLERSSDRLFREPAIACFDAAIEISKEAMTRNPSDGQFKERYDRVVADKNKFLAEDLNQHDDGPKIIKQSVECLDQALKYGDGNATIYVARGNACYRIANLVPFDDLEVPPEAKAYAKRAIESFKKAIALDPKCKLSVRTQLHGAENLMADKQSDDLKKTMVKIKKSLESQDGE